MNLSFMPWLLEHRNKMRLFGEGFGPDSLDPRRSSVREL